MKFKKSKEIPICPYCQKPLEEILKKGKEGLLLATQEVYFCPHCKKLLGVGRWWWSWTGM